MLTLKARNLVLTAPDLCNQWWLDKKQALIAEADTITDVNSQAAVNRANQARDALMRHASIVEKEAAAREEAIWDIGTQLTRTYDKLKRELYKAQFRLERMISHYTAKQHPEEKDDTLYRLQEENKRLKEQLAKLSTQDSDHTIDKETKK